MKRGHLVEVKRMAEFLSPSFSPQEDSEGVVQEITRLCSFENLSSLKVNKSTISKYPNKNPNFFRKGEIGDWKNNLTAEMVERLDQTTKKKLHGIGSTLTLSP